MSRRYDGAGKRISSKRHAERPHWCSCGRTVFGNGGASSHKRANPDHRWLTYLQAASQDAGETR